MFSVQMNHKKRAMIETVNTIGAGTVITGDIQSKEMLE